MGHPNNQAERRTIRRQFINKRIKNGGSWTSCQCGNGWWWYQFDPNIKWNYLNHPGERGAQARSRTCWNCFAHTSNPAWTGKLDKWHIHPHPNHERDWEFNGVIRRDFRNGGGNRANEWGVKRPRTGGRFRLYQALGEWNDGYATVDESDDDDAGEWHGSTPGS